MLRQTGLCAPSWEIASAAPNTGLISSISSDGNQPARLRIWAKCVDQRGNRKSCLLEKGLGCADIPPPLLTVCPQRSRALERPLLPSTRAQLLCAFSSNTAELGQRLKDTNTGRATSWAQAHSSALPSISSPVMLCLPHLFFWQGLSSLLAVKGASPLLLSPITFPRSDCQHHPLVYRLYQAVESFTGAHPWGAATHPTPSRGVAPG